ncbi:MAG: Na+/H+ antiporter NhaA [Actinobacteria bacterium]|nr:Na+/H+ antiporter NhaA [Actinomycetota bacterium]
MRPDPRHRTWSRSDRFVPRRFVRPLVRFIRIESASGGVLLVAAVAAMVWANSPWSDAYHQLFEGTRFGVEFGPLLIDLSLAHLINEGLMAIFFFVVGLEIKRELVVGELRDPRTALLPIVAALGGMVVPAAIYVFFTSNLGAEAASGWAIPMATDIAFAVGVIALLGNRVPADGKLFLLTLAIADDLGAIVVIAIVYSSDLEVGWLLAAIFGLAATWISQRVGIRSYAFYVPVALAIWYATLAGVALGFLTPARSLYSGHELDSKVRTILDTFPVGTGAEKTEKSLHEAELLSEIATESIPPLNRLENRLLPWSSFVVVPLFALANAGLDLRAQSLTELFFNPLALTIAAGLLVGKIVGITSFAWLAVRLGWGRLPRQTNWNHIVGLAALGGIGFTVSLVLTNLAFTDPTLVNIARAGIVAGSLLSGAVGSLLLLRAHARA